MDKALTKIEEYLIYVTLFLFPISVFTISSNIFIVPKLAVLVFGILLILLVRTFKIINAGRLDFSIGKYDLPVVLLAISYIASTFLRTPNKMEALLLPGTTTAVVAGALLYFLINQMKERSKRNVSIAIFISASIYSLMSLMAFSGLFDLIPQLPAFMKAKSFTPSGGFLPQAIFLGTILPIGLGALISEKDTAKKALLGVIAVIVILGLSVSIFNVIPGQPFAPRFPSVNSSWQIAVDSLKTSPLLGVGPGNYLTAFNRYRPLFHNFTDLWSVKYSTASNYYLTLLTETGILGMAALIILIATFYKDARRELKERKLVNWGFAGIADITALLLLFVLLAVFPATILLIVLFFTYLSLNSKTRHTTLNLTTQATDTGDTHNVSKEQVVSRFPALLITVPVIILVMFTAFRSVRILQGEYKFKQSLDALVRNDAQSTYDLMRQAIEINPMIDRYRATFSRVNLILANATAQAALQRAQNSGGQASPITDQERQNITQLIQQAISEGKTAVALNPLRAGNWEILARTYQSIIPFAQGSDVFAVQTFRQAIALDPLNPNLRIALGGIHYARKDYDNAINIFNLVATTVKPDMPNAHYNLAYALKEKGEIDAAIREMTTVMTLITDKSSQDYQTAKKALEDLQSTQASLTKRDTENLTAPEDQPEQVLTPPLELPEDAEPPEAPISPTPTEDAEEEGARTISPTPSPLP